MSILKVVSLIVALSILSNCARISIHDNKEMTGDSTGIKFYTPKPYVLVTRTGAKDKPIDIQIVYFPDLKNPLYARAQSGFGSSNLTMSFANGMMTTFGQQTDTQLPELITAVSGIPGLLATAEKTRREADALKPQSSDLPGTGKDISGLANDLDNLLQSVDGKKALTTTQQGSLARIKSTLETLAADFQKPGAALGLSSLIASAETSLKNLRGVKPGSTTLNPQEQGVWNKLSVVTSSLEKIIGDLKPKPKTAPTLTLYELVIDGTGTHLKEVPIN